jgi:hypothetical protein
MIGFAALRPQAVWALRMRLGEVLSEAHPPPRRRLVELRTPARDPARLEGKRVAASPLARYP